MPDREVLAFAVRERRAVVTLDRRDFIALHHRDARHYGIIVCSTDADVERQARRIDEAVRAIGALEGQLIRINRPDT